MKLLPHQQKIKDSAARYVVGRLGRRTGKDTLIESMADGRRDIIVYPTIMMSRYALDNSNRDNLIRTTPGRLSDYIKFKHHERIFLNEPALYEDLHETLRFIEKYLHVKQIYLIGTPLIERDTPLPTTSGFLFDAICARLEVAPLDGWDYIRTGLSEAGTMPKDIIDDLKGRYPKDKFYGQELEAGFYGAND